MKIILLPSYYWRFSSSFSRRQAYFLNTVYSILFLFKNKHKISLKTEKSPVRLIHVAVKIELNVVKTSKLVQTEAYTI